MYSHMIPIGPEDLHRPPLNFGNGETEDVTSTYQRALSTCVQVLYPRVNTNVYIVSKRMFSWEFRAFLNQGTRGT